MRNITANSKSLMREIGGDYCFIGDTLNHEI